MVRKAIGCGTILALLAAMPSLAESPQQQMFPGPDSCYARVYSSDHLAKHPAQRVTRIAISPDFVSASPQFAVALRLAFRGPVTGTAEATGYCENNGGSTIYCGLEGDAGGFQITPAKGGAILITVSSLGLAFETDSGFVALERDSGDDRSFLLRPAACR